jgi:hypothetical protein
VVVAELLDVAWSRDSEASNKHYAYRVHLCREVLVSLRKAFELYEAYMSAGKWDEIPYDRIAYVVMHQYKDVKQSVADIFDKVCTYGATMAAGIVVPHDLVTVALKSEDDMALKL